MTWLRRNRAIVATMLLWVVLVAAVCLFPRKTLAIVLTTALLGLAVVAFFMIALSILRDVAGRNTAMVAALIALYVSTMIALFANLYRWTGLIDTAGAGGGRRSFLTALYFSTVTWTTLGYGDVLPGANSRAIAAAEALTGYVAMALFIALITVMVQKR